AAAQGQLAVVKLLTGKKAKVNARDSNGSTALIEAAVGGHLLVVQELLAAGADPSLVPALDNVIYDTALMRTILEEDILLVKEKQYLESQDQEDLQQIRE